MSADGDPLPPHDAPLSERLTAAMHAAGYRSDRKLALEMGMADGSLVGKWRRGKVERIQSYEHQQRLAVLLNTPADYFAATPPAEPGTDERWEEVLRLLRDIERRLPGAGSGG